MLHHMAQKLEISYKVRVDGDVRKFLTTAIKRNGSGMKIKDQSMIKIYL